MGPILSNRMDPAQMEASVKGSNGIINQSHYQGKESIEKVSGMGTPLKDLNSVFRVKDRDTPDFSLCESMR